MKKFIVLLSLMLAGILSACNTPNNNSTTIDSSSLFGVWENTAIQLPEEPKLEFPYDPTGGKIPGVEMRMYRCFSADKKMLQAFRVTGILEYNRLYQIKMEKVKNVTYSVSGNNITVIVDTDEGKVSQTGTLQISGNAAVLTMPVPNKGTMTIWMKKVSSPTEADIINAPLMNLEDLTS